MSKLSIITINYNNKTGLKKTIESILEQTFQEFEYIIIDGGSTDGSVEIIKQYEHKVNYWVSEKDSGVYNAMNKGIARATADYFLFLNSGDYLVDPSVLEALIKDEKGDVDLIYGNLQRTFVDGTQDTVEMPGFITVETMMTSTLCHPVTLIHRRLFKDYGLYDERLKIVADWAFFLKVICLGNATQKHKTITVSNFMMDGMSSLPQNQETMNEEREWVKQNYFSPAFIQFYEEHSLYKTLYHNKWMQHLRKLKKSIVKKRN